MARLRALETDVAWIVGREGRAVESMFSCRLVNPVDQELHEVLALFEGRAPAGARPPAIPDQSCADDARVKAERPTPEGLTRAERCGTRRKTN